MSAVLGPVPCQGCRQPVAWWLTYWSDDAGNSAHRCKDRTDFTTSCVCGGAILVRDGAISDAISRHNERKVHRVWRETREIA